MPVKGNLWLTLYMPFSRIIWKLRAFLKLIFNSKYKERYIALVLVKWSVFYYAEFKTEMYKA